jgi:hypothetical protein
MDVMVSLETYYEVFDRFNAPTLQSLCITTGRRSCLTPYPKRTYALPASPLIQLTHLQIRSLELDGWSEESYAAFLGCFPVLMKLHLQECVIDRQFFASFTDHSQICPGLEMLELDKCEFHTEDIALFVYSRVPFHPTESSDPPHTLKVVKITLIFRSFEDLVEDPGRVFCDLQKFYSSCKTFQLIVSSSPW